jgi:hypothetical protein
MEGDKGNMKLIGLVSAAGFLSVERLADASMAQRATKSFRRVRYQ